DQLKAYNKLKDPDSDELVEEITDKMIKGESLSPEEKEILFQHFQDELTDEDYKHMEELAIKIEDEEALKDYVNEKVLYSEANLEKEILLLQKYLYTGNERPDNLPGNTDERAKLQSYLDILQNHYTAINEVKREANGIEVGKDGEIKKVSTGIEWEDYSKSDPLLARVEYIKLDDEEDTNNDNYYRMKSEISIDYHQEIDEDRGLTRESYLEGP